MKHLAALTWLPEFNVVVFALLLNYPWEFLQAPLFDRMADAPHRQATIACSLATVGDAMIMLVAYWIVSAFPSIGAGSSFRVQRRSRSSLPWVPR